MDTFVDSSWYFLRYLDPHNDTELSPKAIQEKWMPIDIYFGGAEHTTMHLLYSRFWQKALFDLGLVTDSEPYKMRINRGLVLGPDGNKMSKSKGNVVDPDEHVKRMGADTVKMYLAFMGPYGEGGNFPWDLGGIAGLRRFLERVYGLSEHIQKNAPLETTKLLHKTIAKVGADIEQYKFNTAISACMIFVNHVEKAGINSGDYKLFLRLLAPFAPHLTEELWHQLGESESIHATEYPIPDATHLQSDEVQISVQINGKMRGTVTVPHAATESDVLEIIKGMESFRTKLTGSVTRVVYVPQKIINIIIQ
jgi:leucyl-tRNA synthetase